MESKDNTTRQLMFSLIEVWKSSGKTQIEFCREKDIAYHKFHYWFKKFNSQHLTAQPSSTFTRIDLHSNPPGSGGVELIYPDGRKLIFHQRVDAGFLRSLLG